MSGLCSRHLERRRGIYGFRVRVPDDIRPLIGMVEVRRSLRTSDPLRARALAALIAVRLFEVFDMVRQGNWVTADDVRAIIAQTFDQMARGISSGQGFPHNSAISESAMTNARVGATVGEALDSYLRTKKPVWTSKTLMNRVRKLDYLREFLGADTPLNLISPDDVRSFRDAIASMRANKGLCRAASFASRRTDSEEHRIDPKTATLNFEPAKAFFRWCNTEQGYIAVNPAENIRMTLPKKRKGDKPRRPFSTDELKTLFSSPLFTGCQSRSRRFERGSTIIKDAKFWLPVLGYYTGARLGELVQLHIRDVEFSGPVPYLHITEQNAGKVGGPDAKHVKSEAGVRRIPLHPDLVQLGFQHFVEARRMAKRSSKRLFYEVNFGSDGQASTVFSKFFGRLLDKVGLRDSALVFHSFRHGAEDAFRNALQPQYVIDRIIGHSDGATSAAYGEGVSLDVAHSAVAAMSLEVRLPRLWNVPVGREDEQ